MEINNEKITRLAKPVRKGLLGFVFSRFFLIVLLFIIEIAVLVGLYVFFTDKLPIMLTVQWIFVFIMILYLFNNDMDSSAKLTWMLIIALFPLPGALIRLKSITEFSLR